MLLFIHAIACHSHMVVLRRQAAVIVFAAILGGLGFCIYRSVEAGDIQRLQSLPDYQGTQCTWLSKVAFFLLNTLWHKFVFAPLLHHKKSDDFQAFNFFLIQDP